MLDFKNPKVEFALVIILNALILYSFFKFIF